MTRKNLNRTLFRLYLFLGGILVLSLLAKFADHIAYLKTIGADALLKDGYEFVRDMSLLIATGGVAHLTNVFQRRSKFVESLEQEWRNIVQTKSALYAYCEKSFPTADDYIDAFCRISATLDNMRIVYANAGETQTMIGLYPYAPLHDMRRALQSLDPRKQNNITTEQRKLARDAILQSFYALRENFLEELDLEQPEHPLLISGGRRLKVPGALRSAVRRQERQRRRQLDRHGEPTEVDDLLLRLYEREKSQA
jgi:hypothetical protein